MEEELIQKDNITNLKKKWFIYSKINLLILLPVLLIQFNPETIYEKIDFYLSLFIYFILVLEYQIYLNNLYIMILEIISNFLIFLCLFISADRKFITIYSILFHLQAFFFSGLFYTLFYDLYKQTNNESIDSYA